MFCKNCGNQIKVEDKFCENCGAPIEVNSNKQVNENVIPNNVVNQDNNVLNTPLNQEVHDEDLLKDFVGKKYHIISNLKFSIWTFLFGPLYFFYRKMYLYGIIFLLLELTSLIHPFLGLIVNILGAIFFSKIYITWSTNKINKLKEQNRQLDYNELSKICIRKGGTSFVFIAIYFGVIGGIALLLYILTSIFMPIIVKSRIEKINATASSSKVDSLSYIIPSGYQKDTSTNYDYYVKGDNCSFMITSFDLIKNISEQEFLNLSSDLGFPDDYELKNETINDIEWKTVALENSDNYKLYFYLKNYNNKMYALRYDVDNSQDCFYEYQAVAKSLKLK